MLKTRRIFQGVVEGISHYGNCLVSDETFIWRDSSGIHFDTIGNFVELILPSGQDTFELSSSTIETLSYDRDTGSSCWQPVRRVFKHHTQQLVEISTALGRNLSVTPDHRVLVLEQGDRVVKPAAKLERGDSIPLLLDFPQGKSAGGNRSISDVRRTTSRCIR